jgi:hypothetical protein
MIGCEILKHLDKVCIIAKVAGKDYNGDIIRHGLEG